MFYLIYQSRCKESYCQGVHSYAPEAKGEFKETLQGLCTAFDICLVFEAMFLNSFA